MHSGDSNDGNDGEAEHGGETGGGHGTDNEVELLGGFAFSVGGDAVLGISVGSQRLIAFLAERDRPTTRKKVAGTLWPESSDERAGASLRSAMARLEGRARDAVEATGANLGLADDVGTDVREARSLAHRLIDQRTPPSEADIGGEAVSSLSDETLPGWYDDWVLLAAEDWHLLRTLALETVATRLADAGRFAEATTAALAAVRAEHCGRAPGPPSSRCRWPRGTRRWPSASSSGIACCCRPRSGSNRGNARALLRRPGGG